MKMRIIFGAVMIAVLSGLLWCEHNLLEGSELWRGVPLTVVLAILGVGAFRELSRMAAQSGVALLPTTGVICTLTLASSPLWVRLVPAVAPDMMTLLLTVMGLGVLAIFIEQMARARIEDALRRVACTIFAVAYLGIGGAVLLNLRMAYQGVGLLLMVLAAAKGTDMGAYFTGKAIGRHKLIPWLSPGKTWEGLIGGMAAGAGLSLLVRWLCDVTILCPWQTVVFGLVVGLFGQAGDLCESLLKRSAKVKDSGSVLPEFGGVLDILDSPLIAAPIAQLLVMLMG